MKLKRFHCARKVFGRNPFPTTQKVRQSALLGVKAWHCGAELSETYAIISKTEERANEWVRQSVNAEQANE